MEQEKKEEKSSLEKTSEKVEEAAKAVETKIEEKIEEKKEKIRNKFSSWFKGPYSKIFLGIFILGIVIRIYFFWIAGSQPLWWDESDYMAYAKSLAGISGTTWTVTAGHNSLLCWIIAGFFKIGLNEITIKFIIELIPSILIVLLTYKLLTLMYKDKRIALICSFLMATAWPILFNTYRFHLDIPALFLMLLTVYIFWQGYERKEKIFGKLNQRWAIPITVLLIMLTYAIRRGYFIVGFILLLQMIFTKKIKDIVLDKYNWIAVAIGAVCLFVLEKFVFITSISKLTQIYYHEEFPFTWLPFQAFQVYFAFAGNFLANNLFYLFYLGLIILVLGIIFYADYIKQAKLVKIFGVLDIVFAIIFWFFGFMKFLPGTAMSVLGAILFIGGIFMLIKSISSKTFKISSILDIILGAFVAVSPFMNSPIYAVIIASFILFANGVFSLMNKPQDSKTKANIFALLMIVLLMIQFLFIQRNPLNYGEERYYFPLLLGALICISSSVLFIADYLKKYSKYLGMALIIFLIGFGGYYEFHQAQLTINGKVNSFSGIKEVSLIVKQISKPTDIVFVVPEPQTTYYSERKITGPRRLLGTPSNQDTKLEDFLNALKKPENQNIKYIIVTFSEPNHPDWMRRDTYTQDGRFAKWEIPFMDTTIDFTTGQQDIKQEKTYGSITFKLVAIKQDAFLYEIIHT